MRRARVWSGTQTLSQLNNRLLSESAIQSRHVPRQIAMIGQSAGAPRERYAPAVIPSTGPMLQFTADPLFTSGSVSIGTTVGVWIMGIYFLCISPCVIALSQEFACMGLHNINLLLRCGGPYVFIVHVCNQIVESSRENGNVQSCFPF